MSSNFLAAFVPFSSNTTTFSQAIKVSLPYMSGYCQSISIFSAYNKTNCLPLGQGHWWGGVQVHDTGVETTCCAF